MPKMKTNKTTAKRFSVKKSGKVKFKKRMARHLLTQKSPKSKRQKRGGSYLGGADVAMMSTLLPYG